MSYLYAVLIGIGLALAMNGFWSLQETAPVVAQVVAGVVGLSSLIWVVKAK